MKKFKMKLHDKYSTKEMLELLPKKFNVFYTLPSGRSKSELNITRRRLNTIIDNEYRYYGVVISLDNGLQIHEQSEFYKDNLLWEVL